MKSKKKTASHRGSFSSGASLGGKVSHYREKQNIYTQGEPAYTLFYIQEGGVRLSSRAKHRPSAVTAILGGGRSLWRALPRGLSPSRVHRRRVDREFHTHRPEKNDAADASQKE
jgi:hypothetical protein